MSKLRETLKEDAENAANEKKHIADELAGYSDEANKSSANHRDDAGKNIEPCKTKEEFCEYAFNEFVKIEGKGIASRPGGVYADSEGHPTIGVGHLVVDKRDILGSKDKRGNYVKPNASHVAEYKKKFIDLPLLDSNGKPLTAEVKGKKFDQMVAMIKSKKRGLTNTEIARLKLGHLNEKGMQQVFAKDVNSAINRAIKDHPEDFWNLPRSAQASLVHMYFWGKGKVAKGLESTEQETIGEQLPEAVRIGKVKPNIAIRNLADRAERDSVEYKNRQIEFTEIQNQSPKKLNLAKMNGGMER